VPDIYNTILYQMAHTYLAWSQDTLQMHGFVHLFTFYMHIWQILLSKLTMHSRFKLCYIT